jgi:hypothetical protein
MDRIQGSRLGLVQLQDLDRWIRVLQEEEIHVIQEPLLRYRRAGDGSSISAPSPEKFHRHYLESAWIVGNTIRDMEDKLFRAAFRQEMKRPGAETPEETEIEKALLLCTAAQVLLFRLNIGVIIQDSDLKMIPEPLQHRA